MRPHRNAALSVDRFLPFLNSMAPSIQIAMVAGEASGDLLSSMLIQGLQARWPYVDLVGIGGPKMDQLGFESWWPSHQLAVRGYVEVLKHYRKITDIRSKLKRRLIHEPPSVFIGVDAPDFNLGLSKELKRRGIPTVHFVCPSVWAWRAKRLKTLGESTDHVLCLFPFEPELLAAHGIDATYVGHPVAQMIPSHVDKLLAKHRLNIEDHRLVLGILPGSRLSEIQQLTARFIQAAAILERAHPNLTVVIPAAPGLKQSLEQMAQSLPKLRDLHILEGQSHEVMACADIALVASGTATLEAALFKCPMVIAYAMPWLSWEIIRRQRLQKWVGLPNILCRDFVVPELLQSEATPLALSNALQAWLDQPERVDAMRRQFTMLHQTLTKETSLLATNAIEKILVR